MKILGWRVACKVMRHPRAYFTTDSTLKLRTTRNKEVQTKMDANTRHFETELQAQAEETARRATKVHSEANVVTATAL